MVVWKENVTDLHVLSCAELQHLMSVVDVIRDALLTALDIEKVYLIYMDEARHVHWHLVPRYTEQGLDVFHHAPTRVRSFPFAPKLRAQIVKTMQHHREFRGR